jgi:hypothetical protein
VFSKTGQVLLTASCLTSLCSAMTAGLNGPLPGSVHTQPNVLGAGGDDRRTPLASYFDVVGGAAAPGVSQAPSSGISNVDAMLLPGEVPGARPRGLLATSGVAARGLVSSGGGDGVTPGGSGGGAGSTGGLGGFSLAGYAGGVNVMGGQMGQGGGPGVQGGNVWSPGILEGEGVLAASGGAGAAGVGMGGSAAAAAGGTTGTAAAGGVGTNGFSPLTSPVSANLGSIAEGAPVGSQELNLEHLLLPSSLAMLS